MLRNNLRLPTAIKTFTTHLGRNLKARNRVTRRAEPITGNFIASVLLIVSFGGLGLMDRHEPQYTQMAACRTI
jgi:hypothetical protein